METKVNISLKIVDELTIRQRRTHILGKCPVCGCNDANFNKEKLVWRCWHCPSSGRIIPEEGDEYVYKEVEEPTLDVIEIRNVYTGLTDKYHNGLTLDAVNYLHSRGLSDDTIAKFKLGFCSSDYYDEYANAAAEDSGVIYQDSPALLNRIVIPYYYQSEVTDLRGRVIDFLTYKPNTPTYMSLGGSHKSRGATFLFNHDVIASSKQVIITEGEFKAILAVQYGFPVVATSGIFAWDREWSKELKDKEVILAADTEERAGLRSPAYMMAKYLKKDIPQLKIAHLFKSSKEKKVDIDSMILKGGAKSFENAIRGAMDSDAWLKIQERKGYGR